MRPGHRPTEPILRFADKLLPARQHAGRSNQANGPPVITAPARTPRQLLPKVVELAAAFSASTARGPSPSSRRIQGSSCKNPASLAGGSRDTKRSLLAVAQHGKRRHIEVFSVRVNRSYL